MRFHAWLIAAAAALVLTACGGGDESTAQVSAQPQRAQPLMASSAAIIDANRLMDFAQSTYPGLFAGGSTAGTLGGILYRHYASSGIYIGVVVDAYPNLATNGVYVMGGPFSGLTYVGQLSNFITPTNTSTTPTATTKNLTVTVSLLGQTYSVLVGAVPVQGTQTDFCGSLTSDSTLKTIAATYGTAYSINSCSFNGTTGSVSASVAYQGQTVPFTVTYTFT